jgi:hypothetical protein
LPSEIIEFPQAVPIGESKSMTFKIANEGAIGTTCKIVMGQALLLIQGGEKTSKSRGGMWPSIDPDIHFILQELPMEK